MRYICFLVGLFSMACSNEKQQEKAITEIKVSNELISIDSLFYSQFPEFKDSLDPIAGKDVSSYYDVIDQPEIEGYFYDVVPEFLRIDSLKRAGEFENYLEHIDIGQLQNAQAYLIKSLYLTESKSGKVWGIHYSSV